MEAVEEIVKIGEKEKRDEDNLEFTTDPSKIKQIEKDERRIRGHALAITHHP
jgi:hypothetical protein